MNYYIIIIIIIIMVKFQVVLTWLLYEQKHGLILKINIDKFELFEDGVESVLTRFAST